MTWFILAWEVEGLCQAPPPHRDDQVRVCGWCSSVTYVFVKPSFKKKTNEERCHTTWLQQIKGKVVL